MIAERLRRLSHRLAPLVLLSLVFPIAAAGQEKAIKKGDADRKPPKSKVQVFQWTVSPAPPPRGALRIRLLPEYLDRKPGNRATLYYRAMLELEMIPSDKEKEFHDLIQWIQEKKLTPEQLPRKKIRQQLKKFESVLRTVEQGARRERCDWDLRIREMKGLEPLSVRLLEVRQIRQFARILSLRCRLEIAEGRLNAAKRTLQTMFQLARDVAKPPTLVNALVGMALAGVAAADLQHFIQHADAPNLYWALTALPRPLIDLRGAVEQERSFPLQMAPIFRDMDKQRSPEQWRAALMEMMLSLHQLNGEKKPSKVWTQLALGALLIKAHPEAKRSLIANGRSRESVEAMPAAQAVTLHAADTYHYLWGETFKSFYLPYPQSAAHFQLTQKRLQDQGHLKPDGPGQGIVAALANGLLPAVAATLHAQARTQRLIAELRCIEALRMYAAKHGCWPESLEQIQTVPVPRDPVTGKPFVYRRKGALAVLELSALPNRSPQEGRRIELTLRKNPK